MNSSERHSVHSPPLSSFKHFFFFTQNGYSVPVKQLSPFFHCLYFFFQILFLLVFLTVLGLCCSVWASPWGSSLQQVGLVAPRHVGSDFPSRDRTHVPCIGRWILKCWTTREVPSFFHRCRRICWI